MPCVFFINQFHIIKYLTLFVSSSQRSVACLIGLSWKETIAWYFLNSKIDDLFRNCQHDLTNKSGKIFGIIQRHSQSLLAQNCFLLLGPCFAVTPLSPIGSHIIMIWPIGGTVAHGMRRCLGLRGCDLKQQLCHYFYVSKIYHLRGHSSSATGNNTHLRNGLGLL